MFFDEEDLDEEIAGYLATAGTKEREDYLDGLDLLKRRFSSGLSSGMQNGGSNEDNILRYYFGIDGYRGDNNGKKMLDLVLSFANDKMIVLDPNVLVNSHELRSSEVPRTYSAARPEVVAVSAQNVKKLSEMVKPLNGADKGRELGVKASKELFNSLNTDVNAIYNNGRVLGAKASKELLDILNNKQYVSESVNPKPMSITDLENAIELIKRKEGKSQVQPEDFTKLFAFIPIPGNGNCLFNSIAWWILQYNNAKATPPLTAPPEAAAAAPEAAAAAAPLFDILKDYTPDNKYNSIYKLATVLRAMVCGFYDGYSKNFEKLNTDDFANEALGLNLAGEKRLLPQIFTHYRVDPNPLLNCEDGHYSGNSEAVMLAYALKFNLFIVNMNNGIKILSEYYGCGTNNRPTIIIVKRRGEHWDVFYPKKDSGIEVANLIFPLSIELKDIDKFTNDTTAGHTVYVKGKSP